MRFRARAFAMHLFVSAIVLSVVLGLLYVGWYRWPGWYLLGALPVAAVLVAVDLGLGPLATLVVANPRKPMSELRRDVLIIVVIQISALVYGATTLWNGRPLFYTFSADRFEIVSASDIDGDELEAARRENPEFVPDVFSRPRWVWAPLPGDPEERQRVVQSAVLAGKDVIAMPKYFRPFEEARASIKEHLKTPKDLQGIPKAEIERLTPKLNEYGAFDKVGLMLFDGPSKKAIAVVNRETLEILAIVKRER